MKDFVKFMVCLDLNVNNYNWIELFHSGHMWSQGLVKSFAPHIHWQNCNFGGRGAQEKVRNL